MKKFLWCVPKNGSKPSKVGILKDCPKTYKLDTITDKVVFKVEELDGLVGTNTYCLYYKDEISAYNMYHKIQERNSSIGKRAIGKERAFISDLQKTIAEKDETIKELNGELAQIYSHLEVEAYLDQQKQALKEIDKLKKKATIKFEKLLAEKEKEIDGLKSQNNFLMETHTYRFEFPIFDHDGIQKEKLVSKVPVQDYVLKAICHQVCEKVKLLLNDISIKISSDDIDEPLCMTIDYEEFIEALDKIEQGE